MFEFIEEHVVQIDLRGTHDGEAAALALQSIFLREEWMVAALDKGSADQTRLQLRTCSGTKIEAEALLKVVLAARPEMEAAMPGTSLADAILLLITLDAPHPLPHPLPHTLCPTPSHTPSAWSSSRWTGFSR